MSQIHVNKKIEVFFHYVLHSGTIVSNCQKKIRSCARCQQFKRVIYLQRLLENGVFRRFVMYVDVKYNKGHIICFGFP